VENENFFMTLSRAESTHA